MAKTRFSCSCSRLSSDRENMSAQLCERLNSSYFRSERMIKIFLINWHRQRQFVCFVFAPRQMTNSFHRRRRGILDDISLRIISVLEHATIFGRKRLSRCHSQGLWIFFICFRLLVRKWDIDNVKMLDWSIKARSDDTASLTSHWNVAQPIMKLLFTRDELML